MASTANAAPDVVAEITSGSGLSIGQAARHFPPYRRTAVVKGEPLLHDEPSPINPSTIWRWIKDGVRLPDDSRLRLEAARLGGRWQTSFGAIERFIAAQTASYETATRGPAASPRQRSVAAARASKELDAIGI